MRDMLPADCVVTLDAGNHTGWAQRFLRFGRPGTADRLDLRVDGLCGARRSGRLTARSLRARSIAFVGDGGFMMSGAELATAVQHGGRPIVLLFNNAHLRHDPHASGTRTSAAACPARIIVNPDFGNWPRDTGRAMRR